MKHFLTICLSIALLVLGCTTKTELYESQLNREFANGQTVFVKRTDEISRSTGVLTGHVWGESHNFSYQFTIEPGDVVWKGLMRESPKSILFNQDELFLKTITEQIQTDTLNQVTVLQSPAYYKNVDKRYFFKLLGEQYFVLIDSTEYLSKKSTGHEEAVPNM